MSTRRLSSGILLVLAMTAGWGVPAGPLEAQAAAPTVLYLVRHAEVAPDGSPDPSLSAEGRARAARLAEMLRGAGLDAIHTTDYRRTRETAGAVANVTGLPLERYDPRALASLAERLRAAGGTYLVVGHSNTTPALVELLGGDAGPPIPEDEFGRIYKVSVEDGRVTTAVFEYTDGAVAVSSSLAAAALLLADRLSTKEIARRLGVRFDTARRHVQAVLRRLHVNGRDEVADAIGKVVDIRAFFEGGTDVQVTFVLKTRSDGTLLRHDPHRSSMRFRPASTFKIPNTVIGLETGVVAGPDHVFPFHPDLVPEVGFFARSWRSDHTLESAFRNSVYWYYQEVARRVGRVRMQAWLDAFGYGNREMGDEVDSFWLHGDLRISAIEQVRFLSDLLEGRFDVSRPTLESLTEISILEEGDGWKLHGKTGTSNVTPTRENGWLVGWVDAAEQRWYYALNMEGERVWEDWPPGARADLVLRILAHVGVPVEASRTGPDPTEQDGVG